MKHKLITAAILMVGVFFILRTSEAIVIKDHLITKDPKASTSCETPVANYTFTLDDDTAYSWVLTDGKTSGGDFRWFWYGPDSKLHQEWANVLPPWETIQCSWSPLDIQYGSPKVLPGNWYVEFYYNGVYQFTDNFTITSKGHCTSEAIYGEHSKEVQLLRYLRDDVLSQTPAGREIIKLYYQWSSVIVKAMEEDEEFKEEVKEVIDGVLPLIRIEVE
jgi:hypothetical protein